MNRKYWRERKHAGFLSMMDLQSLLDYKTLHRDMKVGNMMGVSQHYRYITCFVATAMLLTSGCMKREELAIVSEPVAYEEPAPVAEPAPVVPSPAPPAVAVEPSPPPPPAAESNPVGKVKSQKRIRNNYSRTPAPRPAAKPTRSKRGKLGMAGAFRGGAFFGRPGIPSYPVWPPEAPSSRVGLDRFIKARTNLSLYDAGQKLKRSFEDAGYLEYSYYAAPGGFVLVTRIEKISAKGDPLPGTERYKLPNQRNSGSLTSFVRGLFLDAPPGFYRYIAVVVSDKPYRTSRKKLTSTEAGKRLTGGSNNLSAAYKKVAFTRDHNVEALIYEFTKNTRTGKVRMIAPGRLTPKIHLAKTKLNKTIASNFRR